MNCAPLALQSNRRRGAAALPAAHPRTRRAAQLRRRAQRTRAEVAMAQSRLPKVALEAFAHAARRYVGQHFSMIAEVDYAAVEQIVDVAQSVQGLLASRG